VFAWAGMALLALAGFLLLALSGDTVRLTAQQIAQYARNAGFTGNDLLTAVAVALAESGGKVAAYNPEAQAGTAQSKGSYGLWQIYRQAHPEFDGWDLNDPQINANAAFRVYSDAGNSFRPWSTYKNGAYSAHLDVATEGVSA